MAFDFKAQCESFIADLEKIYGYTFQEAKVIETPSLTTYQSAHHNIKFILEGEQADKKVIEFSLPEAAARENFFSTSFKPKTSLPMQTLAVVLYLKNLFKNYIDVYEYPEAEVLNQFKILQIPRNLFSENAIKAFIVFHHIIEYQINQKTFSPSENLGKVLSNSKFDSFDSIDFSQFRKLEDLRVFLRNLNGNLKWLETQAISTTSNLREKSELLTEFERSCEILTNLQRSSSRVSILSEIDSLTNYFKRNQKNYPFLESLIEAWMQLAKDFVMNPNFSIKFLQMKSKLSSNHSEKIKQYSEVVLERAEIQLFVLDTAISISETSNSEDLIDKKIYTLLEENKFSTSDLPVSPSKLKIALFKKTFEAFSVLTALLENFRSNEDVANRVRKNLESVGSKSNKRVRLFIVENYLSLNNFEECNELSDLLEGSNVFNSWLSKDEKEDEFKNILRELLKISGKFYLFEKLANMPFEGNFDRENSKDFLRKNTRETILPVFLDLMGELENFERYIQRKMNIEGVYPLNEKFLNLADNFLSSKKIISAIYSAPVSGISIEVLDQDYEEELLKKTRKIQEEQRSQASGHLRENLKQKIDRVFFFCVELSDSLTCQKNLEELGSDIFKAKLKFSEKIEDSSNVTALKLYRILRDNYYYLFKINSRFPDNEKFVKSLEEIRDHLVSIFTNLNEAVEAEETENFIREIEENFKIKDKYRNIVKDAARRFIKSSEDTLPGKRNQSELKISENLRGRDLLKKVLDLSVVLTYFSNICVKARKAVVNRKAVLREDQFDISRVEKIAFRFKMQNLEARRKARGSELSIKNSSVSTSNSNSGGENSTASDSVFEAEQTQKTDQNSRLFSRSK